MLIDKNSAKLMTLAWIISIVFSFAIRLPALYDTSYQWRPLQTELTVYWFVREGINLVNYQTPLYGPPWQIPFEFPLFQAMAAIIFRAGLGSLDFACRLTALLCFYLSALFLYLLCKKIFSDNQTNFAILSLYLWLPYNIQYSTEPLIDYLALALALAYLYFVFLWLETRSSFWNALFATIFGSLGILVKATTMPIVVIPIIAFALRDILTIYGKDFKQPFDLRRLLSKVWARRPYWLALSLMAVIPVWAGSIWTRHTDVVKENSVFTQWLTSKALVNWYFGTWALRADKNIWTDYISDAERYFLPYGLSIFAVLGIFIAVNIIVFPRETTEIRLFIISVIAGIGAALTIFLNLYRHEYYYIALSASMAILGGYGVARFWQLSRIKQHIFTIVFAIWVIFFLVFNAQDYKMFRNVAISESKRFEKTIAWARAVQQYIPLDEWVIVVDFDWSPTYPYLLERKTMVYSPVDIGKPICKMVKNNEFTLVVLADPNHQDNLARVLECFKSYTEVMPGVFQVRHKNKEIQ